MSEQMKPTEQQIPVTAKVLPICAGCKLRENRMNIQTVYAEFEVYDTFYQLECEHIGMCEYIANRAIGFAEVSHE